MRKRRIALCVGMVLILLCSLGSTLASDRATTNQKSNVNNTLTFSGSVWAKSKECIFKAGVSGSDKDIYTLTDAKNQGSTYRFRLLDKSKNCLSFKMDWLYKNVDWTKASSKDTVCAETKVIFDRSYGFVIQNFK